MFSNTTEIITDAFDATSAEDSKAVDFSEFFACYMQMEHNYSKPWNGKLENSLIKQTKVVFKNSNSIYHEINDENSPDSDRIIVDEPSFQQLSLEDRHRNQLMMSESEAQANIAKPNSEHVDWEDKISKTNWTYYQNYLFDKMVAILNKDRIARSTYADHKNEPIFRKTIIESSVKRARSLFGAVFWDLYLVQWLHVLLIQNLNSSYLTIYLDILKGLRRKLPDPVDRMITVPSNVISKYNTFAPDNLKAILSEDWTPINENILFGKVKSLPTNSIILLIPSSPATYQSKYTKKWNSLLSVLATVVAVDYAQANEPNLNMMQSADNMIVLIRNKLNEIRVEHINKNIILVGLGSTGSAFACQIAVVEHNIACVVCLGFATRTANGFRGEPDDCIVDIQCPILFIIGQNSNKTSHMDMEDLREKLKTETGLVIVSNADDNLRVSHKKCLDDLITQEYVLKKILGEISDFVSGLLSSTSLSSSLSLLPAAGVSTSLPVYSSGHARPQTITIDIDQLNRQKERKRSYHEISYPTRDFYQPKQKKVNESKDKTAKSKYKERKNAKNQNNLQKQNVGTKTTAVSLVNPNVSLKSTKKSNLIANANVNANANARPNQSFYISSVGNNRYVYTSDDGISATAATHYANHDNIEYIFNIADNTMTATTAAGAGTMMPAATNSLKASEYYVAGTDYIEIIE